MSTVYEPSIFGRIVTGSMVETWCVDQMRKWMGTYMAETERQSGVAAGSYQRPRSYTRTISFDKWPEDQLPGLMLISTGIAAPPRRDGDGLYTARWVMSLGVLCSAATQQGARDMAALMMGAVRTMFVQKPSLGGHASGIQWLDERYDDLVYDDLRTLCSGRAHFSVEVDNVATASGGPATPDEPLTPETDPWPPWPTVQTVDVDVESEALIPQESREEK